jgi:hypothetical protein
MDFEISIDINDDKDSIYDVINKIEIKTDNYNEKMITINHVLINLL